MKKRHKEDLRQWTLSIIKDNPYLYGGDAGNPAIIKRYLEELHGDTKIRNLTLEAISESVAVSRIRNELLLEYPEFDCREIYKPKKKFVTK